jgi:hypothetical protein
MDVLPCSSSWHRRRIVESVLDHRRPQHPGKTVPVVRPERLSAPRKPNAVGAIVSIMFRENPMFLIFDRLP